MAVYPPPPPNSGFVLTPPIVFVVRHVRITGSGEVVAEDGATLVRHVLRLDLTPLRSGHALRMSEDHPPMRVHQ